MTVVEHMPTRKTPPLLVRLLSRLFGQPVYDPAEDAYLRERHDVRHLLAQSSNATRLTLDDQDARMRALDAAADNRARRGSVDEPGPL